MPRNRTPLVQFRRVRPYGEMAILAVVYLLAARGSLALDFAVGNVRAVWPPSGIALAVLLLRGPRLWPGIAVGAFLANWLTHVPALAAAGIAAGNTLEGVAAVWLLSRMRIGNSLLRRLKARLAAPRLHAAIAGTGRSVLPPGGLRGSDRAPEDGRDPGEEVQARPDRARVRPFPPHSSRRKGR